MLLLTQAFPIRPQNLWPASAPTCSNPSPLTLTLNSALPKYAAGPSSFWRWTPFYSIIILKPMYCVDPPPSTFHHGTCLQKTEAAFSSGKFDKFSCLSNFHCGSSLGGSNSWSTLPDHTCLRIALHFWTTASQLPLGPCLGCLPCLCVHHCWCESQGKTLRALIKVPNPWAILKEVPNPQLNRWDRGWASMDPYWKTSSSHLCSGQGKNERMFSKLFPNRCVNIWPSD